jgi:hypothetical protein
MARYYSKPPWQNSPISSSAFSSKISFCDTSEDSEDLEVFKVTFMANPKAIEIS